MKILIAEDEEILLDILQEKFEGKNFKVFTASSGEEVFPLTKKVKPDIILLDILMPQINGIDILTSLKSDDDVANIPVIMLSNLSEDSKIKDALEIGAVDYMIKTQHPINEVIEKVNKYILKAK